MFAYVVRRLTAVIPMLLLISLVSFSLVSLAPGDPAAMILGEDAPPEELRRLRAQLGFDDPFHVRYIKWVRELLRGNFGDSIYFGAPVTQIIGDRLEPTLLLTIGSGMLAVILAIPLGVLAATRPNSWIDQGVMLFSLLGVSMPNFWLGLNLILVFSLYLDWLPAVGYVPLAEGVRPAFTHLVLPVATLGMSHMGLIARMTRANMLETLRQDYVRTALAKGVTVPTMLFRHALRNALIPTITVIGLTFAVLMGGATVTEQVFVIPGVGRLIVESVARRDFPVLQALVLMVAVIYVGINLLIDLTYALIDPRIKYD